MKSRSLLGLAVAGIIAAVAGCASPSRLGMVKDPETGLQFGSVVENNLFVDAAQFKNRKIKVSTRNTSGDTAVSMSEFAESLRSSYSGKGYQPTDSDDFGIRVDLNVLRSSQVQENYALEYAFLGAAGGGIVGYRSNARAGTAIGTVAGATLGAILGSYDTRDTYIVIAEVAVGVMDQRTGTTERTVTFSRSPRQEERDTGIRPFREVARTRIAVFAGGRSVNQAEISSAVRQRLARIVGDII
jgi:Enterobacterial TraT complement resistance protein